MKTNLKTVLIAMIFGIFQNGIAQELVKNSKTIDTDYKRSSIYTLMVTNPSRNYESDIKEYFETKLVPEKYNNHNLDKRFISASLQKSELDNIVQFLNDNKIAHQLIAKWYGRTAKGGFNMNLIKERGFYDASVLDIKKAQNSAQGISLLADAGQELIGNTFILVNDSKYTNKEEVASVAKSFLSSFTSQMGISIGSELTKIGLDTFGKGFVVSTNSHLFKLVWDEETQARFYNELYKSDDEITPELKAAFDNCNFFWLDYIGTDKSYADVQSTSYTTKSNGELIGRATVKSIDNVITRLQAEYDVFKTKTPIYTSDPITAKIGLKEGLTKKTKFEILEKQLDKDGKTSYVRVGLAKVDTKYPIWDNQFGADTDNPNQQTDKTYFKAISGKEFYPGQLLRQIK
jgi:hypothetical protein